ncbi:MAG: hypothetical protein ACU0FH_13255 [Heliomarina sp.]|uniref:hypothetical protein n=1 Tax=Heliomarina sp. TaxID=2917556 RepID=UPI004058AD19
MKRDVFYKFMHCEYVKLLFKENIIRIGTLDGFRGTEEIMIGKQGDPDRFGTGKLKPGINDPFEGTSFAVLPHSYISNISDPTPEEANDLRALRDVAGLNVPNAYDILIEDVVVPRRIDNHYIFCGSKTKRKSVIDRLKQDSALFNESGRPYDTCLPIIDTNAFTHEIATSLAKLENWADYPRTNHAEVTYRDIVQDIRSKTPLGHSNIKHEVFRDQQEYRVAILRKIETGKKFADITLEGDITNIFGTPFPI